MKAIFNNHTFYFVLFFSVNNLFYGQIFEENVIAKSYDWELPVIIDLDQDGFDDMVSVSSEGTIAWWEKDANYEFTRIIIDESFDFYTDIDVIDIDGDNDLDILVSEFNSIIIYYNDGFENFTPNNVAVNLLGSAVVAGDFDGDGLNDFVTASRAVNIELKFWKNMTNNNFTSTNISNGPIQVRNDSDINIQDIDDDGDLDIIVVIDNNTWQGNNIVVFLNDGSANFTEVSINFDALFGLKNVKVVDFDNDGDKDIYTLHKNDLILFTNDGTNNFTPNLLFDFVNAQNFYLSIDSTEILDYDGDGDKDILFLNNHGEDGEYTLFANYLGVIINQGTQLTPSIIENVKSGERLSTLDYNNDGNLDLIVTSPESNGPKIFESLGNGNYSNFDVDDNYPRGKFYVADFNNDGSTEILTVSTELSLWDNLGGFDYSKFIIDENDFNIKDVIIYDIDNDGLDDIVVYSTNLTGLWIWHNQGNFNFNKYMIDSDIELIEDLIIADFNNDNLNDIILSADIEVILYDNAGSFNFNKIILVNTPGIFYGNLIKDDVDDDGDNDVIYSLTNSNSPISCFVNNGNNNFQITNLVLGSTLGGNLTVEDYFDLNNDGLKDLITNQPIYFQNTGNLNYTQVSIPKNDNFYDIDKDGDLDILSTLWDYSAQSGKIAWYENDGIANFTEHIIETSTSYNDDLFTIQDFDGDGDIDFVTAPMRLNSPEKLSFFENNGNQNFTRNIIDQNYSFVFSLLSADLDEDGDIDVISSHRKRPFTIWKNTTDIPVLTSDYYEITKEPLYVYPNPTSSYINIATDSVIERISIYSIDGKKIADFGDKEILDFTSYPKGIYILNISTKLNDYSRKIIKIE